MKLEKTYKKLQKKLNKKMEQAGYFERKCGEYEQKIDLMQNNINKAENVNT